MNTRLMKAPFRFVTVVANSGQPYRQAFSDVVHVAEQDVQSLLDAGWHLVEPAVETSASAGEKVAEDAAKTAEDAMEGGATTAEAAAEVPVTVAEDVSDATVKTAKAAAKKAKAP